jgi:hypothetical protein
MPHSGMMLIAWSEPNNARKLLQIGGLWLNDAPSNDLRGLC